MCGIAGVVNWSGEPSDRDILRRMVRALRHRGPDDQGVFIDRGVGRAHARLSVVDAAACRQPMSNEDGTLWITFNVHPMSSTEARAVLVSEIPGFIIALLGKHFGVRAVLEEITPIGSNSFFWVRLSRHAARRAGVRAAAAERPSRRSRQIVSTTEAEAACIESGAGLTHLQGIGPFHLVTDEDVDIPAARSVITLEQLLQSSTTAPWFPTILADDLAALMFTSGSTAAPRRVMVSHGNIIANTTSIIQSLNLTNADRMMAVLPFRHCVGASLLHTHLHPGGSLVVDSRFMYPEVILDRMIESECTGSQ